MNHKYWFIIFILLWVPICIIPLYIISDHYVITSLHKVNVNSSELFTNSGIYDWYINNNTISIIDDCDNLYIFSDHQEYINDNTTYAVKYNRHVNFDGKRYVSEIYILNTTPSTFRCSEKYISKSEFKDIISKLSINVAGKD